jgi:hypothetical protein
VKVCGAVVLGTVCVVGKAKYIDGTPVLWLAAQDGGCANSSSLFNNALHAVLLGQIVSCCLSHLRCPHFSLTHTHTH